MIRIECMVSSDQFNVRFTASRPRNVIRSSKLQSLARCSTSKCQKENAVAEENWSYAFQADLEMFVQRIDCWGMVFQQVFEC